MGRPKGSVNGGFLYAITRKGKELEMASKTSTIDINQLSSTAAAYKRLLSKAIKCASPDDSATLQRIGTGLNALSKALSAIERAKSIRMSSTEQVAVLD